MFSRLAADENERVNFFVAGPRMVVARSNLSRVAVVTSAVDFIDATCTMRIDTLQKQNNVCSF